MSGIILLDFQKIMPAWLMDYRTQAWTPGNSQGAVEGIRERDVDGLGVKGGSSGHGKKRKNSS